MLSAIPLSRSSRSWPKPGASSATASSPFPFAVCVWGGFSEQQIDGKRDRRQAIAQCDLVRLFDFVENVRHLLAGFCSIDDLLVQLADDSLQGFGEALVERRIFGDSLADSEL